MKKNKLYTVNKGNIGFFRGDRMNQHIFDGLFESTLQIPSSGFYDSTDNNVPKVNWSDPVERGIAQTQISGMVDIWGKKASDYVANMSKPRKINTIYTNNSGQSIYNPSSLAFFGSQGLSSAWQGGAETTSEEAAEGAATEKAKKASAVKIAGGIAAQAASVPFTIDGRYYKRGMFDAFDPFYHAGDVTFSGGQKGHIENAAGNTFSDAGVGVFQAGAGMGNGYVMLAGAALKSIGDIINNGWGVAVNDEKVNAIKNSMANMNNYQSVDSLDDLTDVDALVNSNDTYKGGVFSKSKARGMEEELSKRYGNAYSFATRARKNNSWNILQDQINGYLRNYRAYGGPINTGDGALRIMQNDKYLDSINYRSDAIANRNTNGFGLGAYTTGAKTFDDGGQLKAAFLDDFSTDPIGAAIRYNQGVERMQAAREAAAVEAQREQDYLAMQQRLASLETQNQGLQALMAAQPTIIPETPDLPIVPEAEAPKASSTPSKAVKARRSGNRNWDYIEQQLRDSGKFNDVQIEGIKYNLQRESAIDPTAVGDGGAAFGLGQWHGSRKPKDMSLEGQTRHLIETLSNFDGNNHWIGRGNYEGFLNARTPEEAHYYIARGYERPAQRIVDKVKRDSDMSLERLKAFGGELGTNSTDFTNGLLYIDEGGTHESNPLDGVPMGLDAEGIPNLVEEGETVYNDYVFSDRMMVPDFMYKELGLGGTIKKKGKGMSFADASKKLAQESEQRPNDPISIAGLETSLSKLAEVQETERAKKQMEEYMGLDYACGGNMRKYGLGGNMFDDGGALAWVKENHPTMSSHQQKQIAQVIQKRIAKRYPQGAPKDIRYSYFYNGLTSLSKNEKSFEQDYRDLVADGMSPNTALNVVARGASPSTGIKDKDKWIERYKRWNAGNPKKQERQQAAQPTKPASEQQAALQSAAPQSTPETSTPATETSGSSRRVKNTSSSVTTVSRGMDSNFNYGNEADIADKIAFDPHEDEVRASRGLGQSQPVITDEVRQGIAMDGYQPEIRPQDAAFIDTMTQGLNGYQEKGRKPYQTWMRYAPVFGAGLMSLTDMLGLTNNPDYTMADKLEAAASKAGYAPHISYNPVGNYLTYNPMDIWFEQNRLDASTNAANRAMANNAAPIGTKMAGILANTYNSQLANGNLYRQALEYNDAKKQAVEDFNRRTNMFNSQMGLEADMANARYRQQAQSLGLSGLGQAAAMRDSIDQRVGAARSANITNFLNSLGDIGRENFAMNQINDDDAYDYGVTASGLTPFKRRRKGSACGGRINRCK